MKSKNIKRYIKALLTTSCLIAGTGNMVAAAAVQNVITYPTDIGAMFSNGIKWSPRAPIDGDSIGTIPVNRTIFADVTDRQIGFMIRSSANAITAPVYIFNNYTVNGGLSVPTTDPIRQTFMNDGLNFTLVTSGGNLSTSYSEIYFNGTGFSGSGAGVVSPNSKVTITGDNIRSEYQTINLYGSGISGGAGILDLVGTPTGAIITYSAIIDNLRDVYVRANNFATFGKSVTLGRNLVLYDKATYQLGSGTNLTALKMLGDSASSTTHLVMVNNNIVDAMIGQGTDVPISDARLLAGTGQFNQSVKFTGDVTQSASTILNVSNNFTAARLVPIGIGQIFSINTAGTAIVDTNIGSNGNTPVPYISIIGGGIGEFKQDVNVSISITLGNNSAIRFDKNVTGPLLTPNLTGTTVEFANPSPAIANIVIGPINRNINVLKFSGTDVTLPQSIFTNTINFSNATTPANITVGATQNVTVPITTAATTRIHNIYASATIDRNASTGSNTNPFGAFYLTNNNIININNTSFYSDVQTTTNNTGTVNFVVPGSFSYDLGTATNALNNVIFQGNGTVNARAYAQSMTVNTGVGAGFVTRAFDGVTPVVRTTNGISLQGANSSVLFGDNAVVNSKVLAATNNVGIVNIGSKVNLTGDLGSTTSSLSLVNLNSAGAVTINGNIYSQEIDLAGSANLAFNGSKIVAPNGIIFKGPSGLINLAQNSVVNAPIINSLVNSNGIITTAIDTTPTSNITINGSIGSATNIIQSLTASANTNVNGSGVYLLNMQINGVAVNINSPVINVQQPINFGLANSRFISSANNAQINASIQTANANTGTVVFNGTTTMNGSIGNASKSINLTNFNANSTINGSVYATEIDVAVGVTANFKGTNVATPNGVILQGAGATANFGDNLSLNDGVYTTVNNTGTVSFGEGDTIYAFLGTAANNLALVKFNGNAGVFKSIYAQEVDIAAGKNVYFSLPSITVPNNIYLLGAGATYIANNSMDIFSSILTKVNNTGTAYLGGSITGNIGSSSANLASAYLGDITVNGDIYSQFVQVGTNASAIFNSNFIVTSSTQGIFLQGVGASATFGPNANITGPITTGVNHAGSVTFQGPNPNPINSNIGSSAAALALVTYKGNATQNGDIYSDEVDIAANTTVNFTATNFTTLNGLKFLGSGAEADFTNNVIFNGPAITVVNNTGTLKFLGTATVNGTIGSNTQQLALVSYGGNSTQNGDVYATEVDIAAGTTTTFNSANVVTINGIKFLGAGAEADFTNNVTVTGGFVTVVNHTGTAKFLGTANLTGNLGSPINALAKVIFSKNATLNGSAYVDEIDIAAGATSTFNSATVATTNGLILQGVGAQASFGDNIVLNSSVMTTVNNTGTASFGENPTINGDLGSSTKQLALIAFNGNASVEAQSYAQMITIAAGKTVDFDGASLTTTNGLVLQGAGATADFNDPVTINGPILTTVNHTGTVNFLGTATVNDDIGDPTNSLALVNYSADSTQNGDVYSDEIDIAAGTTTTFNSANINTSNGIIFQGSGAEADFNNNITLNTPISTVLNHTGTAKFLGTATIGGNLGSNDYFLSLVDFNQDSTVNGDVYVDEIDIAANSTTTLNSNIVNTVNGVVLEGSGATVQFGSGIILNSPVYTNVDSTGTASFLGTATVNQDLGTANNQLSLIRFNGDSTLNGNPYADEIDVAAGAIVSFNSSMIQSSAGIVFEGLGAEADFIDGTVLNTNITTLIADTGIAKFVGSATVNSNIGSTNYPVGLVSYQGNAMQNGDLYATEADVAAGTTTIFNSNIVQTTNGIFLQGLGAVANFSNGGQVNSSVLAVSDDAGKVILNTGTSLNGNLGSPTISLALVDFEGNSSVQGNIYSSEIDITPGVTATLNSSLIQTTNGIILEGNSSTVSIGDCSTVNSPIFTNINQQGIAKFGDYAVINSDIGTQANELSWTDFNNSTVNGSVYAQKIKVQAGKTANFNTGVISTTDKLEFQGMGATAIFAPGVDLKGVVNTTMPQTGDAIFYGGVTLNAKLGSAASRIGSATFIGNIPPAPANARSNTKFAVYVPNNILILNQDIHSVNIDISDLTVNVTGDRTLDGNSTLTNTIINYGMNDLTFTGGNSKFLGNPVFNVYFNNTYAANSHAVLEQNIAFAAMGSGATPFALPFDNTLDVTTVDSLTFNVNDQAPDLPAAGVRRYYYFYIPQDLENILFTPNNQVTVNSNNIMATWGYDNGVLYQERNIDGGMGGIIDHGPDLPSEITDPAGAFAGSDLDDLFNELRDLVAAGDLDQAWQELIRILAPVNPTAEAMVGIIADLQNLVEHRIDNVVFYDLMAAGDDKIKEDYGVWFEPFYGKTFQKGRKMQVGYNARATGLTLGVDTSINDKTLIGATLSYLESRISYKFPKTGDKSKIRSFLFTLYGMHEIHDNFFMQGIASIGTNKVENGKPRLGELAKGKYRATSYGLEVLAGYKCQLNEHTIVTPIVGTKYSRFDAENYSEKDTTFLNFRVKKKAFDKFELIAGAKLDSDIALTNYELTPQVHGFIHYDAFNKATRSTVYLEGLPGPFVPYVGRKPARLIYNLGGALAATKNFMEYEFSYDFRFAPKFRSHQAGIKLKVKF